MILLYIEVHNYLFPIFLIWTTSTRRHINSSIKGDLTLLRKSKDRRNVFFKTLCYSTILYKCQNLGDKWDMYDINKNMKSIMKLRRRITVLLRLPIWISDVILSFAYSNVFHPLSFSLQEPNVIMRRQEQGTFNVNFETSTNANTQLRQKAKAV